MIGLLATTFRTQLGPMLNGIISTADVFVPSPKFNFPGVEQFEDMSRQVILWPPEYRSGNIIYPYTDAKK